MLRDSLKLAIFCYWDRSIGWGLELAVFSLSDRCSCELCQDGWSLYHSIMQLTSRFQAVIRAEWVFKHAAGRVVVAASNQGWAEVNARNDQAQSLRPHVAGTLVNSYVQAITSNGHKIIAPQLVSNVRRNALPVSFMDGKNYTHGQGIVRSWSDVYYWQLGP